MYRLCKYDEEVYRGFDFILLPVSVLGLSSSAQLLLLFVKSFGFSTMTDIFLLLPPDGALDDTFGISLISLNETDLFGLL